MKLSFCTIALQQNKYGGDKTLDVAVIDELPRIAAAGYAGVELWAPHVADLNADALAALKARLGALGLAVPMVSPYFKLTKTQEQADASVVEGLKLIETARALGATGIRCFTGGTASADATEEQWTRAVTALQTLADAGPDLMWALETHSWNLMDTIESSIRLVCCIGRRNVRLILQPSTFGADWRDATTALAPYACHVHATNKTPEGDFSLEHGEMDWAWIVDQLRAANFAGFLSVEYMGPEPERVLTESGPYMRGLMGA
jgi:sugar phosphate isomerase/epimerase